MKKIIDILFSTRLMSMVIVLFASAMAIATFVENDHGTQSAKALIYNTWWFELLMFLLVINFIGNIFKYRLFRKEKWAVLLFHLAFIITLLGAFITRYFGYEGVMLIREGEVSNTILSENTFVEVFVDDSKEQKDPIEKKVLFGSLSNNYFEINNNFRGKEFSIKYVDVILNAKLVFKEDNTKPENLHLVVSTTKGREDIYIAKGNVEKYGKYIFTFDNPIAGGINFIDTPDGLTLKPNIAGTWMEMQSRKTTKVPKDSTEQVRYKKLYRFGELGFVIKDKPTKGSVQYVTAPASERSKYPYHALFLEVSSGGQAQQVLLLGAKNAISKPQSVHLNDLNFRLKYGSKEIKSPFSIKLRDFQLERYPGSNSPSSFASEITVIDKDQTFDYRIFMNHVLDYKGFRFFQASYDPDEKGTHLSVNHDYWGTLITYLGYLLMGIGMFFSLFTPGSRFKKLSENLKKQSKSKILTAILLLGVSTSLLAQNKSNSQDRIVNKVHADKFGRLLIQDHQGRVKPVNTYALEALRKIYKKDKFQGLTAEQVLLSAQLFPEDWSQKNIVKIVYPTALGKKISKDLKAQNNYISMAHFFVNGKYYLEDKVSTSFQKKNSERNATDKEIINLDERANIWWNVLNGNLMHLYPKTGDTNNKWYTGTNNHVFTGQDTMVIKLHELYFNSLRQAVNTKDYSKADEYLNMIGNYQKTVGSAIIPPTKKINLEIQYNRWNIFKKLMFYYMIIGFIFLILAFVDLFKPDSKIINLLLKIFSFLSIIGMFFHVVGMGVRWYVSGHEPWSNGYEAVVFVAFVTVLAGLLFSKNKSKFTLASTVIFASFLLGIAHGSLMSPEMTTLVPVLKSYWLMIHVAVITSSYGFLGLGALLGFVVLLLYILRTPDNAKRFNHTINELTQINESALTVGLYTLSIGTFLGGVWASESWGRYWSWDPKEVWSLISMMVYIFVLHMRLVPGLKGKFAFNLASLFSIATLIMTFFGVNFYLSGMHSYAAGDPVPIPNWIYFAIAFFIVFSIVSYFRYKSYKGKYPTKN